MSYVVHIWEQAPGHAWPRKVDDAVAWLDWLQDLSPGQNPKFIEFARRLTACYPDLSSPEARLLPVEEQAWSDGPMNGETKERVYGIGIATGNKFGEVRPFVLQMRTRETKFTPIVMRNSSRPISIRACR